MLDRRIQLIPERLLVLFKPLSLMRKTVKELQTGPDINQLQVPISEHNSNTNKRRLCIQAYQKATSDHKLKMDFMVLRLWLQGQSSNSHPIIVGGEPGEIEVNPGKCIRKQPLPLLHSGHLYRYNDPSVWVVNCSDFRPLLGFFCSDNFDRSIFSS